MLPCLPALCSVEAGSRPLCLFIAMSYGVEWSPHRLRSQFGATVSQAAAVSIRVHVLEDSRAHFSRVDAQGWNCGGAGWVNVQFGGNHGAELWGVAVSAHPALVVTE